MQLKLIVVILLLVVGLGLLPLENSIRAQRLQMKYGGARVTFALREAIGQDLAIALLAGMRGVVADFLWIHSHSFWEKKEWLSQSQDILNVSTSQQQPVL